MNSLDELRTTRASSILFECIAGSRAYGTSTAASDEDVRGVFAVQAASYIDLARPPDQVGDESGNVVYYSLRRVIELLTQANPNILELLFMPADLCPENLAGNAGTGLRTAHLFISKQCADTHAGYAMSQIQEGERAKQMGQQSEAGLAARKGRLLLHRSVAPRRTRLRRSARPPRALKDIGWSLNEYHAARLEHAHDTYRLYHYGKGAKRRFQWRHVGLRIDPAGRTRRSHFRWLPAL